MNAIPRDTLVTLRGRRGFVFDLDGTLVQRSASGTTVIDGASEVLDAIRASGRPLVAFTNASHVGPERLAAGVREVGLDLADHEMLTPICSALSYLHDRCLGARTLLLGTEPIATRMAAAGIDLVPDDEARSAEVVLVAHVDAITLPVLEGAAQAVLGGARFLTGNYAPAYAGANGPIISRGAMIAAAIARASGRRPTVVGKPSRAAYMEVARRLAVPFSETVVVGDDIGMDIALGRLGGAHTILVGSGITGSDLNGVSPNRRPDLVIDTVGDLLDLL